MTPDFRNEDALILKRVKARLLSRSDSRSAWEAIQAAGVGVLLRDAYADSEQPMLERAIKKAGVGTLKVLLGDREFGRLMRLRRLASKDRVVTADIARFAAPFAPSGEPGDAVPANELIRALIETAGSGRLVAPILASAPEEDQ